MTRTRLLLGLAALAAFVLFASLGRWQLDRAAFKEQRQRAIAAAMDAPPRALAEVLTGDPSQLPVQVRADAGRYLDPAVLLDNQIRERQNGIAVYRAFQPVAGPAVLVELGWLAWLPGRQLPPLPAPPAGALPRGLLVPWPGQALALAPLPPAPEQGPWLLPRLERTVLAEQLGLSLYDGVLRLDPDADHGFARTVATAAEPMPPERHRGYAVQWFALAALVAIVFGVLSWKHRRRR